ncbi:hypothetical protein SAMN04489712_10398 [Thermomonospora echinospora]|uniref:Uncharacterized protein n=1 Tax=Thermomonospora echinospora TaxID=1992 RepID=A0A1H5X5L8_9ACTN|nr:hypothetical protein SAMN04489712_10398 [Thermomonospora echinospora]
MESLSGRQRDGPAPRPAARRVGCGGRHGGRFRSRIPRAGPGPGPPAAVRPTPPRRARSGRPRMFPVRHSPAPRARRHRRATPPRFRAARWTRHLCPPGTHLGSSAVPDPPCTALPIRPRRPRGRRRYASSGCRRRMPPRRRHPTSPRRPRATPPLRRDGDADLGVAYLARHATPSPAAGPGITAARRRGVIVCSIRCAHERRGAPDRRTSGPVTLSDHFDRCDPRTRGGPRLRGSRTSASAGPARHGPAARRGRVTGDGPSTGRPGRDRSCDAAPRRATRTRRAGRRAGRRPGSRWSTA